MGLFAVCERKNRRSYAAPFMSEIDLAGHVNGYYGPAYYQALATTDKQIETLLSELDRQDLREDTLVIVSPDHSGGALNKSMEPKLRKSGFSMLNPLVDG
jgi:predicted AlkP superfamily pyrophosphatase or phosphodiesterase